MSHFSGPQHLLDAASAARHGLASVGPLSETTGSQDEWAAALRELEMLSREVAAAQDVAIVRLAAIEPELLDSGEVIDTHRAPGHVALDSSAIVSGILETTAVHAERRVWRAVRLAADGPDGTDTCTGLGGLHDAMATGRLDAYRATVVADELIEAPAEVAATVVDSLTDYFDREDGPRLRRRVRRMLARISPDLLRQRAVKARAESSLRRWVDEPGTDTWHGTFPSEEAATAWAAIDRLAQQYVADGVCATVDRARAKALTDLVTGNATIDITLTLATTTTPATAPPPISAGAAGTSNAVPAAATASAAAVDAADTADPDPFAQAVTVAPASGATMSPRESTPTGRGSATADLGSDLVEVTGIQAGEPVLVSRAWVDSLPQAQTPDRVDPTTGALTDPGDELATDAYRPGKRLTALVKRRDGRCRFPGCHVSARFCDLDHVTPWPAGPTSATNLACLCRRHHRIKQRPGWQVRLETDGTLTWTDPTGRTRTSQPIDHRTAVLPDRGTDQRAQLRRGVDDRPHSPLEYLYEHTSTDPPWRLELTYDPRHHRRPVPAVPDAPPF